MGRNHGLLAAGVGLGGAELLGALLPHRPSLVLGIADRVIAITPPRLREWLIGLVGTQDKPLLAIGIVVVVLLLGSWIGRVETVGRRRLLVGVLALIAFLAALGSAGVLVLAVLAAFAAVLTSAALELGTATVVGGPTMPRREFLRSTGLGVFAVVAGSSAMAVRRSAVTAIEKVRSTLRLPTPTNIVTTPAGAAVTGIAPPVTPNADFYRIDTAFVVPAVDVNGWRLSIEGMVDHPRTFTYADLNAMPQIQHMTTIACVSNPVGGPLVGNAIWQGVRLADVLAAAGVQAGADQLIGESVDAFTAGFPLELALDGRTALIAVGMNGSPLPLEHGFPARLIVPGLYGYVSATKWLAKLRVTTFASESGFWVQQGWSQDGRTQSASRIDAPRSGASLKAGPVTVAGRAWHQHAGVRGVQVSVDGGPWADAEVATDLGSDAWRLWSYTWSATAGAHKLAVRMVDESGTPQTGQRAPTYPGTATGWHEIAVSVS